MNFHEFARSAPGRFCADTFGVDLRALVSWEQFGQAARAERGESEAEMVEWCDGIRERFGTASTGEKAMLAAALVAIDYAWLAEELTDKAEGRRSFFDLATYAGGEWRRAVGAAIVGDQA